MDEPDSSAQLRTSIEAVEADLARNLRKLPEGITIAAIARRAKLSRKVVERIRDASPISPSLRNAKAIDKAFTELKAELVAPPRRRRDDVRSDTPAVAVALPTFTDEELNSARAHVGDVLVVQVLERRRGA